MASLKKRGKVYYARYWIGQKQRIVCLHTKSYPLAKEKLRQIESSLAQGAELPLPSKTSVTDVVSAYAKHVQAAKTRNTAKSELYYLRDIFGPLCPDLVPARAKGTLASELAQDDYLVPVAESLFSRLPDRFLHFCDSGDRQESAR